jgi:cobalt-zinc-cadmium efflux system membrane fusion protein
MIAGILNNAAIIVLPSDTATVTSWKATVTAARATMSGVSSTLTATDRAFANSLVTQGGTGAAPSTIAQSGVKNLEAQLAKTIIVSPISGTIAALPLRGGELAAPGTLIATVVGSGSLQVDAYASADDIARIAKGATASIEGTTTGTVSSVATAINPQNKKVEVKILITDPDRSHLVIGENVSARIQASGASAQTGATGAYRVPIQNVKIVPGEAYVFTVDADSKLVKHDVTLGAVTGDYVEVTGGIAPDMRIVSPVYELEAGQEVAIDQ